MVSNIDRFGTAHALMGQIFQNKLKLQSKIRILPVPMMLHRITMSRLSKTEAMWPRLQIFLQVICWPATKQAKSKMTGTAVYETIIRTEGDTAPSTIVRATHPQTDQCMIQMRQHPSSIRTTEQSSPPAKRSLCPKDLHTTLKIYLSAAQGTKSAQKGKRSFAKSPINRSLSSSALRSCTT